MLTWNETAWFSIFLNAALKSTAVFGVARLAAFALRGRSAAARHLVWTAAAAAVILLPLFSLALPVLNVTAPIPASVSALFETTVTASAAPAPTLESVALGAASPAAIASRSLDWRGWTMLVWAAGSTLALLQMLVACFAMWRVRRRAHRPTAPEIADALAQAMGIEGSVDVLETDSGSMPMTFGVLRPVVFLPSDAENWSEDRRRIVLLHELAHVQRGDVLTHLLARTALTLYWWHPLAWTAWRESLKERERATDDLVLAAGARASEYAGHLLEVARSMQASPSFGWASVAMARRSQLEGRLVAILDDRLNRRAAGRASIAAAVALSVLLVAPFAAVRAQDNSQAQVQADVDATIRAALAQKNHEMLETAASAFEKLRQYDSAEKLLQSAAQIRGEVSGRQSIEYGLGLMKIAALEEKRNLRESAQDFYTRAAAAIGERQEAAVAHMHLGMIALTTRNFDTATVEFTHAQTLDPPSAGQSLMWLGIVKEREKKQDEAESYYKGALAIQDPKSHEAATTMKIYAALLRAEGRNDESNEMNDQANAAQHASQATPLRLPSSAYKVGDGVTAPRVLQKVDPEYSEEARAAKYQGTVLLSVVIGADGMAHDPQVVQGLGLGLDQKAIDAITQWKFQPGTKDGLPVPVAATIEINFRLL